MRCPDCNKFVSFEEVDPEVNDLEVNEDGYVTCNVRIVNACAECGNELKEAVFDIEQENACAEHRGKGHELSIEDTGAERTSRSGYFKKGKFVPAYGRYAKTLYGVQVGYAIKCSCSDDWTVEGTLEDEIQASGMDELV